MTADTLMRTKVYKDTTVLNLTSFKMGFIRINIAPPYQCMSLDPKMFDIMYAKYILENDNTFMELMKIVTPVFEGRDVIILVTMGNEWDIITESIQKLLQQRYNIISSIVYDSEDYEYGQEITMNQSTMYNFNQDRIRFLNLFVSMNGKDCVEKSIITEDDFLKRY